MNLEKFTKAFIKLFFVYVILVLVVGCKTKQKTIERQKEVVEQTKQQTVNEVKKNDVSIDEIAKKESNHILTNDTKSISLTQADNDKTIIIEDNKGNKLTIKGANAVINKSNTHQIKKDSSSVILSKVDKSETTIQSNKKEDTSTKTVNRKADSDVKTTSTWLWVFLILALVLAYVFRKRIFGWF